MICPNCGADEYEELFQDTLGNHRCDFYDLWLTEV
jgi:hypothetical protein